MEDKIKTALNSFRAFFTEVRDGELHIKDLENKKGLELYMNVLLGLEKDSGKDFEPDAVDHYNMLYDTTNSKIRQFLRDSILQRLFATSGFLEDQVSESTENLLKHAAEIYKITLKDFMKKYMSNDGYTSRLRGFDKSKDPDEWNDKDWTSAEFVKFLKEQVKKADISVEMFEYVEGELQPVSGRKIKPPEEFFGYKETQRQLYLYFKSFIGGKISRPLMLDGPQGIGKTEIVLSYAQKNKLNTILAGPKYLEQGLVSLLSQLEHEQRKYLLFFDDLDPDNIDWRDFRINTAGAIHYPDNVAITLITNKDFPDNVKSRGVYVKIPTFELHIAEAIIRDYLDPQIKNAEVRGELTKKIGASYVDAYKALDITEVTPRSLVNYLKEVMSDAAKRTVLINAPVVSRVNDLDFLGYHLKSVGKE